jgi:hypothetical protein
MAVRDFMDSNGINWKVWPVTPESLQPKTAAEDYLGDYGEGWLCFESPTERRRLARYPAAWDSLSDEELSTLLATAAVVPPRKPKHPTPPPNEPRHP